MPSQPGWWVENHKVPSRLRLQAAIPRENSASAVPLRGIIAQSLLIGPAASGKTGRCRKDRQTGSRKTSGCGKE